VSGEGGEGGGRKPSSLEPSLLLLCRVPHEPHRQIFSLSLWTSPSLPPPPRPSLASSLGLFFSKGKERAFDPFPSLSPFPSSPSRTRSCPPRQRTMGIKKSSTPSNTPHSSSPSRMSLLPKSTPSLSTLTTSSPISAHDSLLRLARRSQDLPPSPGSSVAALAHSANSLGALSKMNLAGYPGAHTISPGEPNYDPLENPVTPYPVQTMGVPAFRHEEFGWCANQEYRHTSMVSYKNLQILRGKGKKKRRGEERERFSPRPTFEADLSRLCFSYSTRTSPPFSTNRMNLPTTSSSPPTSGKFYHTPSLRQDRETLFSTTFIRPLAARSNRS